MRALRVRSRHAFTATEFMVVFCLCTILAAIMYPILSAARELARGETISSFERMIGYEIDLTTTLNQLPPGKVAVLGYYKFMVVDTKLPLENGEVGQDLLVLRCANNRVVQLSTILRFKKRQLTNHDLLWSMYADSRLNDELFVKSLGFQMPEPELKIEELPTIQPNILVDGQSDGQSVDKVILEVEK